MKGLSSHEVLERIKDKKVNKVSNRKSKGILKIILSNLFTLFNLINIFLAILVLITRSYANLLFALVIVINTVIAMYQEIRAKIILDNLKITIKDKVVVFRDGVKKEILEEEIVLDDVILLKQGNQVLVDVEVLDSSLCEVDESIITGESNNIIKKKDDNIYSGSIITSGSCKARVIGLGNNTYAQKLVDNAKMIKENETVLRNSLNQILKLIMILIGPLMVLLFVSQFYINHNPWNEAILAIVAAVSGMIPSGLILLSSISASVGIIKMAKDKVVVQKLNGIETLASIDTLCLDKTGTITDNTFKVVDVIKLDKDFEINNIILNMQSDTKNETDKALDRYFKKDKNYEVIKKVPFSSYRKYSLVVFKNLGTFTLGALEYITSDYKKYDKYINPYLEKGLRVLTLMHSKRVDNLKKVPDDSRVIAFIILKDNIRKDIDKSILYLMKEEVDVKILSGDNPYTVCNIMKQINYPYYQDYIDCTKLPTDYYELKEIVNKYHIFGRVTPYQKQLIIKILKENKKVGMIGDGVNDILALKEADCSIALNSGISAIKNVSQIVLIDNDFNKIPKILNEGRRVINNIIKVASLYLVKTIYSFLLTIFSILLFFDYPFYPVQLTLIGILCVGIPSFMLALEPNTKKVSKNILKEIFSYALPSALTVFINVMLLFVLTKIFNGDINNYKMVIVASTGIVNLIVINYISKNSKKLVKFLLMLCGLIFLIALFVFHEVLFLDKYNIYVLMMILVYLEMDIYLIKYLKLIYEKIVFKK